MKDEARRHVTSGKGSSANQTRDRSPDARTCVERGLSNADNRESGGSLIPRLPRNLLLKKYSFYYIHKLAKKIFMIIPIIYEKIKDKIPDPDRFLIEIFKLYHNICNLNRELL